MGRLHSAAFRWCEVWIRSAEEVSTQSNERLHPGDSVFQIKPWTATTEQNRGSAFFPLWESQFVAVAGDSWKRKLFSQMNNCTLCSFMFLPFTESVPVYHHRAGHGHGGQPELWPFQHSHCHHHCHGHQRQPSHADLQNCELLQMRRSGERVTILRMRGLGFAEEGGNDEYVGEKEIKRLERDRR